jgi:MFS family permease
MTALLLDAATVRQYVTTPDNGEGGPEDDIRRSAKAQPTGEGQVPGPEGEQARRAAFRDVFAVGEFRALWLAQILSVAGDQLARVALTVLVYDRTRSALLAAVTYAVSIVPTFIGGVVLGSLADRLPRREVMIACDLARFVLVLVMAVPGMPVGALVALLFAVTLAGAPFTSARAAIYPDVLPGDSYVLGTAVTLTTYQAAQVLGFVAGGTLVAALGVRASLVTDAATFAASAVIVRAWTRWRPAARGSGTPGASAGPEEPGRAGRAFARAFSGARLVLATPALRTPMFYGWLAAFYNAPEGIAAPLARALGGGSITVGLVLGAEAFGSTLGAVAFSRLVDPPRRLRWMGPLAIAACATLLLFATRPRLPAALAILAASGVCACFQLAANAAFVSAAPPGHRSQAFGLAQGGMNLGQGLIMVLAGAAAGRFSPAAVVVVCGGTGAAAAMAIAVGGARGRHVTKP